MNLKNYTSSVPTDRTISRIEQVLAKTGASGINKDFQEGKMTALCFRIVLPTGRQISIRLPVDCEAVYDILKKEIKRPRPGTLNNLKDQAERTAWKLMQDWVEVQMSLIQMQQADFMQVFLPYVWDGKQTFYHALKEKNFLALPGEKCQQKTG